MINRILVTLLFLCSLNLSAQELITGDFELVNHHGEKVTQASYRGKYRLVFFGFTSCPIICPTTMFDISRTLQQLGPQAKQIQTIFITIDPLTDTVDRLSRYVNAFDINVDGLTGSIEQIAKAANAFNASYGRAKSETTDSEDIYHSAYIYLMDPEGKFIDLFGYGTSPRKMAKEIRKVLSG